MAKKAACVDSRISPRPGPTRLRLLHWQAEECPVPSSRERLPVPQCGGPESGVPFSALLTRVPEWRDVLRLCSPDPPGGSEVEHVPVGPDSGTIEPGRVLPGLRSIALRETTRPEPELGDTRGTRIGTGPRIGSLEYPGKCRVTRSRGAP
eukprot:1388705-Rhodomonas_salina.2